MATWNQILDPWVYILLRKAVLRKFFTLLYQCRSPKARHQPHLWKGSVLRSSTETNISGTGLSDCRCLSRFPLPDTVIKSIA